LLEQTLSIMKKARWIFPEPTQCHPAIQELLLGRLPADKTQFETIKSGSHRTVYRIQLHGLDIHLKHNRISGFRSFVREFCRTPKGKYEYDTAIRLASMGIRTIEPIACGVGQGIAPESFLITKTLEGALSLEKHWHDLIRQNASPQRPIKYQLIGALAKTLALMHAKGVLHNDLHPGNLMVILNGGQPALSLIDLFPVRIKPNSLSWAERRSNLAMLDRWAKLHTHTTDRMRLWKAYTREVAVIEGNGAFPFHNKDWVRYQMELLAREVMLKNLGLWQRFDTRCMFNNRRFKIFKFKGKAGVRVADLDMDQLEAFLGNQSPQSLFPDAKVLKHSKSSTVMLCKLPGKDLQKEVIFKKITATKWTDPIANIFRPDGTTRSWQMATALLNRKLPTARHLAFWHQRKLLFKTDGYSLIEKIPNASDMPKYVEKILKMNLAARISQIRTLIDSMASLLRKMHDSGISHRDLKSANLMIQPEENPPKVWLVDLVGVRAHFYLSKKRKMQNLARLNASFLQTPHITLTDRVRFLRQYLRWGTEGPFEWHDWWRNIAKLTDQKIAKNLKSGRPLA